MRWNASLLALAVALAGPAVAGAAPPRVFHLQGVLADAAGTPIDHTYVTMRLSIYEETSTSACSTETVSVPVKQGFFTVGVGSGGSGISSGCSFYRASYLEVQIRAADGTWDSPMTPRIPLTAVPTSLTTERLDVAAHSSAFPAGNAPMQIPINNYVLSRDLHTDKWDSHDWVDINVPIYECPAGSGRLQTTTGTCSYQTRGLGWCGPLCSFDPSHDPPPCPPGCTEPTLPDTGNPYCQEVSATCDEVCTVGMVKVRECVGCPSAFLGYARPDVP